MEALDNIKEKIQDFLQENTKLTVAVCAILLSFAVIAFILGAFSESSKKTKPKFGIPKSASVEAALESVNVSESFFPPKKDSMTEEYYFTRELSSQWSEEEFDEWFTVPTKDKIEELGKANNKVADEILGAAP